VVFTAGAAAAAPPPLLAGGGVVCSCLLRAPSFQGVYTRVTHYTDWINCVAKGKDPTTCPPTNN
jgi:secreted trypsin-like serine protease